MALTPNIAPPSSLRRICVWCLSLWAVLILLFAVTLALGALAAMIGDPEWIQHTPLVLGALLLALPGQGVLMWAIRAHRAQPLPSNACDAFYVSGALLLLVGGLFFFLYEDSKGGPAIPLFLRVTVTLVVLAVGMFVSGVLLRALQCQENKVSMLEHL